MQNKIQRTNSYNKMKYEVSTAYLNLLMVLYQLQKNKDGDHVRK
jgi:hypothetical protein